MEEKIVFNKTKIIATVGPASNSKEMLTKLVKAGVDVFRLNFSHGSHEDHLKVINFVREINKEMGTHVSLLQDLQGPKIRLGDMKDGEIIEPGDTIVISNENFVGTAQRASTTYKSLPTDVEIGATILLDDGKLELKVSGKTETEVSATVVHGGPIKSKKGINLPNTDVSAPCLTEKDTADLEFGLKHDVDWVALSFVRRAEDIIELRNIIDRKGSQTKIIAKIEKPEALVNIDAIIEETDAIMVARGDLGVEIMMEEVPLEQKRIVEKCNRAAKPVIIATQMMESMIENPRPTRAETNDVANAVMDGADTLMLSGETAVGKYPELVIESMVRTIKNMERQDSIYFKFFELDKDSPIFFNDSLVRTACRLSEQTGAKAIVGMTQSGYTGFKLSSNRPKANIFIFTSNKLLLNKLSLVWGVRGIYYDSEISTDDTISDIEDLLKKYGHVESGDVIINTASMPIHDRGRTNMLKISVAK